MSGARQQVVAYGSVDATAKTLLSLASLKSRMVLALWYWLTRAIL